MNNTQKARAVRDAVSGYKREHFHELSTGDLAALDEFLEGIRPIAHAPEVEVEVPSADSIPEVEVSGEQRQGKKKK